METFLNIPYRQYARATRRLDAVVMLPDGRRVGFARGDRLEYQLEGVCPASRRAELEDFWDRHFPGVPFQFEDLDLGEIAVVVFDGDLEIEPLVGQIVWRVPVCTPVTADIAPAPPLLGSPCGGGGDDPPDLDLPLPEWMDGIRAGFDFIVNNEGYQRLSDDAAISNCREPFSDDPVPLPPGVTYQATECEGYNSDTRAGTPVLAGEFRDLPTFSGLRFNWDGSTPWTTWRFKWFWLRNRFSTPSGTARTDWVGPYERSVVGD